MSNTLEEAAARLREAIHLAGTGLVDREALVELVVLAAVAQEHLLVIGPPGTAKSEAVRRAAQTLGGSYFEYLLGRFTEPNEIFGPVDLRRLREGVVETATAGMLPEADVAFLDEVFQGSTAILNTLLGLLNERMFRRGSTAMRVPLRLCVGAANHTPSDESLAAFSDRFLIRVFVEPVSDPLLEELLTSGWSLSSLEQPAATLADLDALALASRSSDLEGVRPVLAHALRQLRMAGVALSDRRAVKAQRVVAAAGTLAGRTRPTAADLWPLIYVVPTGEQQSLARDILRELLAHSDNPTLPIAVEQASAGPAARARRLQEAAQRLLSTEPSEDDLAHWRLQLEGVAREIDAGFAAEKMPAELNEERQRIVAALKERQAAPVQ
jgi:MoxR-like ATPase